MSSNKRRAAGRPRIGTKCELCPRSFHGRVELGGKTHLLCSICRERSLRWGELVKPGQPRRKSTPGLRARRLRAYGYSMAEICQRTGLSMAQVREEVRRGLLDP